MPLKLPIDPGPNADFYDTLRFLQRSAAFQNEQAVASAFNQKAHAQMTDTFGNVLADNSAATREMVAASTEERRQLAENVATLTVVSDKLAQALADLAAANKGATPEQIAEMVADAKALRDEVALLQGDDTAVIPGTEPEPTPAPVDDGSGTVASA